jgi:hypothetical protein
MISYDSNFCYTLDEAPLSLSLEVYPFRHFFFFIKKLVFTTDADIGQASSSIKDPTRGTPDFFVVVHVVVVSRQLKPFVIGCMLRP